jgi:succinyl-diaminopimelate desuccinylase
MIKLLKELIKTAPTAENGELAAAELIKKNFDESGINCELDGWGNHANITAILRGNGRQKALFLSGHLDVVPPGDDKWQYEPFEPVEAGGRIYGRGSADMKGGMVAAIEAIRRVNSSGTELFGDVIFSATAGEETDSCGVKHFMADYGGKLDCQGVIVCEPTDIRVVTSHRGILWIEIRSKGKTAHGSMPEAGINAIESVRKVMDALEGYKNSELPKGCTLSINRISGGNAINVIPDSCTLGIDIRLGPGVKKEVIIERVEAILEDLKRGEADFEATVEINKICPGLDTDIKSEFVQEILRMANQVEPESSTFCTDGPMLESLGPVVIFGPGKGHLCHKPDEYIDIADIEKCADIYEEIIRKLCTAEMS